MGSIALTWELTGVLVRNARFRPLEISITSLKADGHLTVLDNNRCNSLAVGQLQQVRDLLLLSGNIYLEVGDLAFAKVGLGRRREGAVRVGIECYRCWRSLCHRNPSSLHAAFKAARMACGHCKPKGRIIQLSETSVEALGIAGTEMGLLCCWVSDILYGVTKAKGFRK